MSKPVEIKVELTTAEAMAFAQFVKRVGWRDFRSNAVDDDEAYFMKDASSKIRSALAEAGYAPR